MMKDTKTILLALLSVGLVGTWVFYLSEKSKNNKPIPQKVDANPAVDMQRVQDSLQNVYSGTVQKLGAQLDSVKNTAGQLQGELNARLTEILQLRIEITDLLKKRLPGKEDLALAGQKTTRLQQLVSGIQSQKGTVTAKTENHTTQPENNLPTVQENIPPPEKTNTTSAFVASDLKFIPVTNKDDKEVETNHLDDISKLIVSFAVKSNAADYPTAEVFAVVTQPDGKVIQDAWESASMETRDAGRKKYTRKVRFGYQKGETKQLQFSLNPDDIERGNYTLQVYHNGYLIGQTVKTLN